jgi:hypothetical protein
MAEPQKLVALMPWLWLKQSVSVAGFTFAPFLDEAGLIAEPLARLKDTFPEPFVGRLLSGLFFGHRALTVHRRTPCLGA